MSIIAASIFGFFCGFLQLPLTSRFLKAYGWETDFAISKMLHRPRFPKSKNKAREQLFYNLWYAFLVLSIVYGFIFSCLSVFLFSTLEFWAAFYTLLMLSAITLAGIIDLKTWILPDCITIPLIIAGLAVSYFFAPIVGIEASIGGAIYGYLLPLVAGLAMQRYKSCPIGGGDVKIMSAMGAWLGFELFNITLVISFLFFLLLAYSRKSRVAPYGPALSASVVVCVVGKILYDFIGG